MMILAQSAGSGGILAPIAQVFGWIINAIYIGLSGVGIRNVGLCIIIFTVISKMILLPLTLKQQRSMKITQVAQPEINKIQKKYRNKKDQASMMKQQTEMQQVYDKYGTSPTGGCLTTFIQFPIIMALYYVIRSVETYIPTLAADVKTYGSAVYDIIPGINIEYVPGMKPSIYWIIPVLSFLFQFLSMKTSMSNNQTAADAPGAGMTKSMMYTMPVISAFMCITLPAALGIYWSATALVQWLQQLAINSYYNHADMEKIIEKSREKAQKKKAKKGPSMMDRMMGAQGGQSPTDGSISKSATVKSTNSTPQQAKGNGGIASRANSVNRNKGGK